MKMLMHNPSSGFTVAAEYSEKKHEIKFSFALCRRNSDTFSRKRGNLTATTRLKRNPHYGPLPFLLGEENINSVVFNAIRDFTRTVGKRRTEKSLVDGVTRVLQDVYNSKASEPIIKDKGIDISRVCNIPSPPSLPAWM